MVDRTVSKSQQCGNNREDSSHQHGLPSPAVYKGRRAQVGGKRLGVRFVSHSVQILTSRPVWPGGCLMESKSSGKPDLQEPNPGFLHSLRDEMAPPQWTAAPRAWRIQGALRPPQGRSASAPERLPEHLAETLPGYTAERECTLLPPSDLQDSIAQSSLAWRRGHSSSQRSSAKEAARAAPGHAGWQPACSRASQSRPDHCPP